MVTGFGLVMLLAPPKSGTDEATVPSEGQSDASTASPDEPDVAMAPAGGDVAAADAVADATAAEAPSSDVAVNFDATSMKVTGVHVEGDAGPTDAGAADLERGSMVITEPPGAWVLIDKRDLCTTPCLVTWPEGAAPPTVRLHLEGYIDVDLQFGKEDRGTEQRLKLRKQP
jgi:hypothetical protein